MRSIQTSVAFPLSAVKPLDRLISYRQHCLTATQKALQGASRRRCESPVGGARLEPFGEVEGFEYLRCPETGSVFLAELPERSRWAALLADVNRYRHSPEAFHVELAQSRTDTVYVPKIEWIRDTLRLQELDVRRAMEATTPPSSFTRLLQASGICSEAVTVDEMGLAAGEVASREGVFDIAVLLESLDRVDEPHQLLRATARCLRNGGLVFVTALVASGFDMAVLGVQNLYLYPPDRANCFTLQGVSRLLERTGFQLVEVSTPGVLDVEIVQSHLTRDPSLTLCPFERQLIEADEDTQRAFQTFLQQQGLSSFARIVAKKP